MHYRTIIAIICKVEKWIWLLKFDINRHNIDKNSTQSMIMRIHA